MSLSCRASSTRLLWLRWLLLLCLCQLFPQLPCKAVIKLVIIPGVVPELCILGILQSLVPVCAYSIHIKTLSFSNSYLQYSSTGGPTFLLKFLKFIVLHNSWFIKLVLRHLRR